MDDDQIIDPATALALQSDVTKTPQPLRLGHLARRAGLPGQGHCPPGDRQPTPYVLVADSVTELQHVPPAAGTDDRRPCDAPELVEVWLAA